MASPAAGPIDLTGHDSTARSVTVWRSDGRLRLPEETRQDRFDGISYRCFPDGSMRCRWNAVDLAGSWRDTGPAVRFGLDSTGSGPIVSLDALVTRRDGHSELEAVVTTATRTHAETILLRQLLTPGDPYRPWPGEKPPAPPYGGAPDGGPPDGGPTAPGWPEGVVERTPLDLPVPTFDITLTPVDGPARSQDHTGSIVFGVSLAAVKGVDPAASEEVDRVLAGVGANDGISVTLHGSTPDGALVTWTIESPLAPAFAADGSFAARWSRNNDGGAESGAEGTAGAGVLATAPPALYGSGAAGPLVVSEASLTLSFDPERLTIGGSLEVVHSDGDRFRTLVTGGLVAAEVHRQRRSMARQSLAGRWTGLVGRAGDVVVTPDPADPTRAGVGPEPAFLRLSPGPDLAVGLAWAPTACTPLVLRRTDPPAMPEYGDDDRQALRRLALDLSGVGRLAEATPLAARAEELGWAAVDRAGDEFHRSVELSALLTLVDSQVAAAFALRDYPALLSGLESAVRLERMISHVPSAVACFTAACATMGDLVTYTARHVETVRGQLGPYTAGDGHGGADPYGAADLIFQDALALLSETSDRLRRYAGAATGPTLVDARAADVGWAIAAMRDELAGLARAVPELADRLLRVGADRFATVPRLVELRDTVVWMLARPLPPDYEANGDAALTATADALDRELTETTALGVPDKVLFQALRLGAGSLVTMVVPMEHQSALLARADLPRRAGASRDAAGAIGAELGVAIERWRGLLDEDLEKIAALDEAVPFFGRLVELLTDLGLPRESLLASELSRARAFADLLASDLAGRVDAAAVRTAAAPPLDRDGLAGLLRAHGQPVVEYFLTDDRLTVWVATPDVEVSDVEVSVLVLPVDAGALVRDVEDLHRLLESRASHQDEIRVLLHRLYAILWHPDLARLLPDDPDRTVTVVPHGQLLRVPFSALLDPDGTLLASHHPITVLPALALLGPLRTRSAARLAAAGTEPPRLLALVDPIMPVVPAHDGEPAELPDRLTLTTEQFPAISAFYRAGSRVLTDARATLDALCRHAPDADVLILATHAQAAAHQPTPVHGHGHGHGHGHSHNHSHDHDHDHGTGTGTGTGRTVGADRSERTVPDVYIALAPANGHDGLVTMGDILGVRIGADLVALAACQTGGGRASADGVIGLSRAVLAAGATKILMNLATVEERSSVSFLYLFHTYWLAEGHPVPVAFSRALVAWQEQEFHDPRRWAAFTLFGVDVDNRP